MIENPLELAGGFGGLTCREIRQATVAWLSHLAKPRTQRGLPSDAAADIRSPRVIRSRW